VQPFQAMAFWRMEVMLRLLSFAFLGVSGKDPPCPEDATVMTCAEWCKTVYPGSRATMSGSSCARLSAKDIERGIGPACTCYDSGYENELKSCRSRCPKDEGAVEEMSQDDGSCFGSTGKETCRADQLTSTSERYLLYDVKPGEGFNLQREVFPRVGWIVAQLNAGRGGCSTVGTCTRWSLVLPPWCRLAHWRRASEAHVPWERFFDAKALRSTNITVLEFYEYVEKAGAPNVDLVVSTTTERQSRSQMMSKPRRSGGFYGFARTSQQCFNSGSLRPPRQEWMEQEMRWRVTYSGNCAKGVAAVDHRCAVLADSSGRDWVDLVQAAAREGARSVLLKAADAVSPPSKEELDDLGLREAMLFAQPIRDAGERYIREILQSKPFLAVHCRRTDFLHAREATTPSVEAIVDQLELALRDFDLHQVYVATDAPDDLKDILKAKVRTGGVFFLDDMDLKADSSLLEGELAAIEMWIAARATAFIGTQESRFTMHIQLERSWLGKAFETSNRELCKSLASRRCMSPYYKAAGRRGTQHEDYWEPLRT